MKKQILIAVILFAFCRNAVAQNNNHAKTESLVKILPSLKGIERVNCLHQIANEYINEKQKDAAEKFLNVACEEASRKRKIGTASKKLVRLNH